jgi:hypothetical protein
VVFPGIQCASFAKARFMEIMSFTHICPENTILATYAKGIVQPWFFDNITNNLCDVFDTLIIYRQHPGQYDYFQNYDDLEVCCTILICLGLLSHIICCKCTSSPNGSVVHCFYCIYSCVLDCILLIFLFTLSCIFGRTISSVKMKHVWQRSLLSSRVKQNSRQVLVQVVDLLALVFLRTDPCNSTEA